MKKNYVFAIFTSILLSFSVSAQVSYSGNTNSGFGGTVGGSTLEVSDDGTTITFEFSRGGGNLNDVVVIYIDSELGGFANNSSFTDSSDGGRRAVSAYDGSSRPGLTFPSGFEADYAISFSNNFSTLFELTTGSHTFVDGANLSPSGNAAATTHTVSIDFTEIGITSTDNFQFVVTYIAESAYMSNEVIGTTSSIVADGGGTNPGTTGSITFSGGQSYPNTWTGDTDNDWATAGNWTEGVPSTTDNVHIPSGLTNYPTASAAVTVNKGTIKSGATLIAQSTFSGTLTYERNLATTNWYLMGMALSGETIEDLITNNSFASGTSPNIGLAPYNNSGATASDRWDYQTAASTGSLTSGGGYSVKLASTGDFSVIGTMEVADVGVAITDNSGGSGNAFNLVGNPYTSFLAANSNADGTNNLLTVNSSDLTENTLWLWNQSANSGSGEYVEINQTTVIADNPFIAPGQGFFVSSTGSNTFNFTEAMQSHQSTDTFQRANNNRPEINLKMTDGTNIKDVDILYIDGMTTGFDNGYDSSIFSGVGNSFAIYTHAVANGNGRNLGIQSLPNKDHETMVIPVGIIAENGKEITFSAEAMNLPAGLKVFLEDRENDVVTRLDEANANYSVTLNEALNGVGRFYLHTTSEALSTENIALEGVNVFSSDKNTLRVTGINSTNASIKIFNVLGKKVLDTSFSSKGATDINLPNLNTGVYIVQLASEKGKLNKKIVLN